MLTTLLEDKVRGGKWHALIDKVYAELNLYLAARKVTGKKKAAGVDGQSSEAFEEHLIVETRRLSDEHLSPDLSTQAVRRVQIPKPGRPNETRPLGIPTVRDRVVQRAVVNVIEPILDHQFHERSFGFRHGRGAHDALRIVEQKISEGYVYVVDADLKGYFDTIPKDRLLKLIKAHISDSRLLKLIRMFLDQSILEELREWTPIAGVPQGCGSFTGAVESVSQSTGSSRWPTTVSRWCVTRTTSSFCAAASSRPKWLLQMITEWVEQAGLTLHPTKTKIVDSRTESFAFSGLLVSRGQDLSPPREPCEDEGADQGTDSSQEESGSTRVDRAGTQPSP